jgi:uncharacterized phage protein (TIGR01671 family)
MTRGIKFRQFDPYKKLMNYEIGSVNDGWASPALLKFDITPLMQCIGLKDKNGKEMYETDIVTVTGDEYYGNVSLCTEPDGEDELWSFTGVVKMVDCVWIVIASDKSSYIPLCDVINDNLEMEIIGNAYETLELLK